MQEEFWHERWKNREIGFHQQETNPYLMQHLSQLHVNPSDTIFVPLCGKSGDMVWLSKQGYKVFGVELHRDACAALFQENNLSSTTGHNQHFQTFDADNLSIWCGNFFNLTPQDLESVNAVYDRASLIALPPDMRQSYSQHMNHLLSRGTRVLLVTMEYPQTEMSGPPFAVSATEVVDLYGKYFHITKLGELDILEQEPHFRDKGLSRLIESVTLLEKK